MKIKQLMMVFGALALVSVFSGNAQAQFDHEEDVFVVNSDDSSIYGNDIGFVKSESRNSAFIDEFLKDIEFETRMRVEIDDNVFLTENDEQSDVKPVFTQIFKQKTTQGKHYIDWSYQANYEYFINEDTDVLSQAANALYAFRPYDELSIALGYGFDWLKDSEISTTIDDRLLSLGYQDHSPYVEIKYEYNPRILVETAFDYRDLDVRDANDDDFIDHRNYNSKTKFNYDITNDNEVFAFLGYEFNKVDFKQINQKSAKTNRPFIGILKKWPNFANATVEVGYVYSDIDNLGKDQTVDFGIRLESTFSTYTKLETSYYHDRKNPSLRQEYAQYGSNQFFIGASHSLSPSTTILADYTYEQQNFESDHALVGQSQIDRDISLNTIGAGVEHRMNSWLTLEGRYTYAKRKADFNLENYTDNKYIVGLTARY